MKYVEGNLVSLADAGQFDVIVHGCNCFHTMGRGIAHSLRLRWPEIHVTDCKFRPKGDREMLGLYSETEVKTAVGSKLLIINAYTQYTYWDENDMLSLDAVESIFYHLFTRFKDARIGIPKIGAGLARGSWDEISSRINKSPFNDLTCVVFK